MKISQQTLDTLKDNGYSSIKEYMDNLSEEYGIPYGTVVELANLLGHEELFDGLVSACMDIEGMY